MSLIVYVPYALPPLGVGLLLLVRHVTRRDR